MRPKEDFPPRRSDGFRESWEGRKALSLGLICLGWYALTMPSQYGESGDARYELGLALFAPGTLRPNHLLLTPLMVGWLGVVRSFWPTLPPLLIAQGLNALAGAGGVAFVFGLLRKLAVRPGAALLWSLFMGLSAGYWLHSREAEAAMVSQTCSLLALGILLGMVLHPQARPLPWLTAAAGIYALSVLLSFYYILLAPAYLVMLVAAIRRSPPAWRAVTLLLPVLIFLALLAGTYGVAYAITGRPEAAGFLSWLTTHPEKQRLALTLHQGPLSLLRAGTGLIHLLVAGSDNFTTAAKLFLTHRLLIPPASTDLLRFLFGLALLGWVGGLAWRSRPWPFREQQMPESGGSTTAERIRGIGGWPLCCLLAFGLVLAFNVFWLGSDPQFWLPGFPFLLFLAALGLEREQQVRPRWGRIWQGWGWVGVGGMLCFNASAQTPTALNPGGGTDWQIARDFSAILKPQDLLLCMGRNWTGLLRGPVPDAPILSLLYPPWASDSAFEEILEERIRQTFQQGGRVYVDSVFGNLALGDVGAWESMSAQFGVSRDHLAAFLRERFQVQPVSLRDGVVIYRLDSARDLTPRPPSPGGTRPPSGEGGESGTVPAPPSPERKSGEGGRGG